MSRISPTLEGFRAATRQPVFSLSEIAWRWAMGAAAWAVLLFTIAEYLQSLPVSNLDLIFLRTKNPFLVQQAFAHILRGSLSRIELAGVVGFFLVLALWIIASSIGRYLTARALLDYFDPSFFSRASTSEPSTESATGTSPAQRGSFRTVLGLSFLRAVAFVASMLALVSVGLFASWIGSGSDSQSGMAVALFFPLACAVFLAWVFLNWFLSLATVFAARNRASMMQSLSNVVGLCRERFGAVVAVSAWSGTAHLALFMTATTIVFFPISLASLVNWQVVVAAVVAITLVYFAIVDYLYTARLAGYICLAQSPRSEPQAVP